MHKKLLSLSMKKAHATGQKMLELAQQTLGRYHYGNSTGKTRELELQTLLFASSWSTLFSKAAYESHPARLRTWAMSDEDDSIDTVFDNKDTGMVCFEYIYLLLIKAGVMDKNIMKTTYIKGMHALPSYLDFEKSTYVDYKNPDTIIELGSIIFLMMIRDKIKLKTGEAIKPEYGIFGQPPTICHSFIYAGKNKMGQHQGIGLDAYYYSSKPGVKCHTFDDLIKQAPMIRLVLSMSPAQLAFTTRSPQEYITSNQFFKPIAEKFLKRHSAK